MPFYCCPRGAEPATSDAQLEVAGWIGQNLATLHNNDMIHGDLTTSNMMIRPDAKTIVRVVTTDSVAPSGCSTFHCAPFDIDLHASSSFARPIFHLFDSYLVCRL